MQNMAQDKHTFTFDGGETTVTVTSTSVYLPDVLRAIEGYLRASGFCFIGNLEIVEDTSVQFYRYDEAIPEGKDNGSYDAADLAGD